MSIVPSLFSDWWDQLDHPHSIPGQNFGHGLHHDDLLMPNMPNMPSMPFLQSDHIPRSLLQHYFGQAQPQMPSYLRPWAQAHNENKGLSVVKPDKDQFHVTLDVLQFKPEEIHVKVVDNHVVIEAKHQEIRDNHGWVSRQFTRKYLIPEQCDIDHVKTSLSSDGVLTITAPRKEVKNHSKDEKIIKIKHTGRPAILPTKATNEVSNAKETK